MNYEAQITLTKYFRNIIKIPMYTTPKLELHKHQSFVKLYNSKNCFGIKPQASYPVNKRFPSSQIQPEPARIVLSLLHPRLVQDSGSA